MSKGFGLIRAARLTRRQLITFALVSAALNGVITASVGAWLAQTYSAHQSRRQAIEKIANLVYERRTRAGMVVSAIRRGSDLDELRYRKRAYDEAYVDWNKNVMVHLFAIREAAGELKISTLEPYFEDGLVAAMASVDRCLTQAYDRRLAGEDAKPVLEACRMSAMHQFVLDCGATFTNELYKLTRLTFMPWSSEGKAIRETAQEKVTTACKELPPAGPSAPAPPAAPLSPPVPQPETVAAPPTSSDTPAPAVLGTPPAEASPAPSK